MPETLSAQIASDYEAGGGGLLAVHTSAGGVVGVPRFRGDSLTVHFNQANWFAPAFRGDWGEATEVTVQVAQVIAYQVNVQVGNVNPPKANGIAW